MHANAKFMKTITANEINNQKNKGNDFTFGILAAGEGCKSMLHS